MAKQEITQTGLDSVCFENSKDPDEIPPSLDKIGLDFLCRILLLREYWVLMESRLP